MVILLLSLTTLYVATLNIKKTALPPGMYLRRFWNAPFPADSVNPPNVHRGDVNISVADTQFENAFFNYDNIVVWGADDPTVKDAKYDNTTNEGIPTLVFTTKADTMENGAYVIFDFLLLQTVKVTQNTIMMTTVESIGNADAAKIEVSGHTVQGDPKLSTLLDLPQNKDVFVFTIGFNQQERLKDFDTINKISIVYYCQPNSSMNITTKMRVFNIFDGIPTLEGEALEWGKNSIFLTDIAFPHSVKWNYLKPVKIFVVSTLHELLAKGAPSLYLMNYTWLVYNPEMAQGKDAEVVVWLDRLTDAPLISATIHTHEKRIGFLDDVQHALLGTERYVSCIVPIPTDDTEGTITLLFDFWPTPWREVALVSGIIIVLDLLVFTHRRIARALAPSFAKE